MPAVAVQARPPRDVKASVDAVLETNNNTRMVSGGNIDYNKLIRADNVPSKSSTAAAQHSAESKKDATEAKRPQMVSCFRSGGSICVPRPAVAGANSLLPKLPEGDTSARDEIRMRMKFGFAKVKAANRMKKLAAAKKEKERNLLELKYPTVEEIAGGQAEFTAECPNFNPKGGLYGVVDLLTEVSGAVLRVGHASAPQIRLGTGYIEKADEDDERRDVQSHDALVKARLDEAELRSSWSDAADRLRKRSETTVVLYEWKEVAGMFFQVPVTMPSSKSAPRDGRRGNTVEKPAAAPTRRSS